MHMFYIDSALAQASQAIDHQSEKRSEDRSHPFVLASVVFSVMFLELVVNSCYSDQSLPFSATKLGRTLEAAWSDGVDRLALLSRFQLALALARSQAFDVGEDPYQSTKLLIDLRNRLTHPKEHFGLQSQDRLEQSLRGKFRLRETYPYQGFFPDQCFSPECALWAINTSLTFAYDFIDRLPLSARKMTAGIIPRKRWKMQISELSKEAERRQLPYRL